MKPADRSQTRTATPTAEAVAGTRIARYLVLALEASRPLAEPWRVRLEPGMAGSLGRSREPERSVSPDRFRIGVPDHWMSSRHASLTETDDDAWLLADEGSKNGTRVNGARIDRVTLRDGDLVQVGNTFLVFREYRVEDESMPSPGGLLRTMSPGLEQSFGRLARVAATDLSVMIHGASGTGKEVAARALHDLSGRRGDFVAVNCGAIPASLIQSELFGHVKGAFSGAADARLGLVRAANGGTLFLDEVAELSESAQVSLLRVLQEREVRAIGSHRSVAVDIRVVTATHADLGARISAGTFREDLYARLAGLSLELLSLRQRIEDIGLLLAGILRRIAGDRARRLRIRGDAAAALFNHGWPLNVRELEQALRLAVTLTDDDEITLACLPEAVSSPISATAEVGMVPDPGAEELCMLLRKHNGNVSAVARAMQTSRPRVRRLAARHGIDIDTFRIGRS